MSAFCNCSSFLQSAGSVFLSPCEASCWHNWNTTSTAPLPHIIGRTILKIGHAVPYYFQNVIRNHVRRADLIALAPKRKAPLQNVKTRWNFFIQHFTQTGKHSHVGSRQCISFTPLNKVPFALHHFPTYYQIFVDISCNFLYSWFRASWLYINKIQRDSTVCSCVFTAKLLYMFRVSIARIIRSTSNCNCSFWYTS